MTVKQIYTSCISQGAYFIESKGESAVIDPLREISVFLDLEKETDSKIKYIFETHFHADFVSGHLTLSKITGAPIVFGPGAKTNYESISASDNQVFKIGDISLTVLHTPGHTLESTSYLLKDSEGNEKCIFTGDTLFLGDVGIPDVAQRYQGVSKQELAGILYDSVNKKIKPLDENILIYPGHGAGSACGKNMMKETVDTLKNQKKVNYALNGSFTRSSFIEELTHNLPDPPEYFPSNVKLNQNGYLDFDLVLEKSMQSLSLDKFLSLSKKENTVVLDTRNHEAFSKSHIPKSIFIGLNGQFAPWAGSILKNINLKILLVCKVGTETETIMRLSRVGFDNILGFLKNGFDTWKNSSKKTQKIECISAVELKQNFSQNINFIDVRSEFEFNNGHIENSINIPLNILQKNLDILNKTKLYYVYCAGGYRSMIASSILKKYGYDSIININGGMSELKKNNFKLLKK